MLARSDDFSVAPRQKRKVWFARGAEALPGYHVLRMSTLRQRAIAFIVLLFALVYSASAFAFVAPIKNQDGRFFLEQGEHWQLAVARVNLVPLFDIMSPSPVTTSWILDAELWLRNVAGETQTVELGVTDTPAHTETTELWLDGQRVETRLTPLQYSPSRGAMNRESARRFTVSVPNAGRVVIGVKMRIDARRDETGQWILEVPTHMLSLLSPKVLQAFVQIDLGGRPVGLTSTLSGYTLYDHPMHRISWFALDWQPRIPLQVVWLESWNLLQKVAEIEECPAPWDVVRHVSRGDLAAVRSLTLSSDVQTLRFCAALPLVIHGWVFPSQRVREQFAQIPLRRYLGVSADRGMLYRPSPSFRQDELPDLERIYAFTLTQIADERQR